MTPAMVIDLGQEAITLTILVSLPMLGLGLIVGLIISIFQATTSIQEMTLTFIPKIIAVFLGLLFFAPWMLEKLMTFTTKLIVNIPLYIR
ncbi:MAG: flagellar biosynthesis protein FliQ [Desulfobacterales bacterium]|nr:flagellar biosynthesis protein FliQ [Desulfobacterales bacterium]